MQTLEQMIKEELGKKYLESKEIPSYITQNLSKELRKYQITALRYYLGNLESFKKTHLMFNMATGSGKTLIMAALMLDCYQKGYRDFVFFVNSRAILEKTIANFSDKNSSKYLFAQEIIINSKRIEINVIRNFSECKKEAINISFITIQGLHSLLNDERENALSFEDFKDRKIVFLSDEAHHINSETKKGKVSEDTLTWEGTIRRIFAMNTANLMLEFSATIPKDEAVQKKYRDKIIFEYPLKRFYEDGYSKKILLLQYNGMEKEERFLGSVLLNIYREDLARKHHIFLKPVVLYKSKTIAESKANQKDFERFIERLDSNQMAQFKKNYTQSKNAENNLLSEAVAYYKDTSNNLLCQMIQTSFKSHFIINANEEKDVENLQILLNTLEDKDNEIRAIFAVDKLNEGWDVLNLFDIVRLNTGAIKETTKEAQLIGRGARYYPFVLENGNEEYRFKRKFDFQETSLSALESLSYHAASENEFIDNLHKELENIGLKKPKNKAVEIKVKDKIQQSEFFNTAKFATNGRVKNAKNTLFVPNIAKLQEKEPLRVPLFGAKGIIGEVNLLENNENKEEQLQSKITTLGKIPPHTIKKAMNTIGKLYEFRNLKEIFKVKSKDEFIATFKDFSFYLHTRQDLSLQNALKIAIFVLEHIKDNINKELDTYSTTIWQEKNLAHFIANHTLYRDDEAKDIQAVKNYEWFVFDTLVGNKLEMEFLAFIDKNKQEIDSHFSKWLIVRNDRIAEFAIYDDREVLENGRENPNYADRFEPDFYFLGQKRGDESMIVECIIEPKGKHLVLNDKWKEEFLLDLIKANNDRKLDKVRLQGLPFFISSNDTKFEERFKEFCEK